MIKLAIVVGHTERSPGAYGVPLIDEYEYKWNKDLGEQMVRHVKSFQSAQAKCFFRDEVGIVGAYDAAKKWGADAAVELHFNAAGPSATGSETLYLTAVSRPLAEAIQDATLAVLGLRDRGVKTPHEASGGRGTKNLSQMGSLPSILTEPFFGSNSTDARVAHERKMDLAKAQAEAAVNVIKSIDAEDSWSVRANSLNVRGGPGIQYELLDWGPLSKGATVEVVSRHENWAFIRTQKGEGFVNSAYLA